jgi:[ribosomal protein S18]-alanine N-acetyltransferase
MVLDRKLAVRPANPADRNAIMTLTRFDERVHVHLDWKPVEDWLGTQPFLVAERGRRVLGSLACPPDPPDTAWLRLFTQVDEVPAAEMWDLLWGRAEAMLRERGVRMMAVLTMDRWMERLCAEAGFVETHGVVVLSRTRLAAPPLLPRAGVSIRPARPDDYPAIVAADTAAFSTPWQMSSQLLEWAIERSDYLTVAERDGSIAGYQLSTPSHLGAHLARLAVLPAQQGLGLGAALVEDLLNHYRGAREITVNTQDTNGASLALYRRMGFTPTGARFPVFQYDLAGTAP